MYEIRMRYVPSGTSMPNSPLSSVIANERLPYPSSSDTTAPYSRSPLSASFAVPDSWYVCRGMSCSTSFLPAVGNTFIRYSRNNSPSSAFTVSVPGRAIWQTRSRSSSDAL